jgi:hypothetical protein
MTMRGPSRTVDRRLVDSARTVSFATADRRPTRRVRSSLFRRLISSCRVAIHETQREGEWEGQTDGLWAADYNHNLKLLRTAGLVLTTEAG